MSHADPPTISRARGPLRSGTAYMVVGTAVAATAAYLFQLVAGRSLGPTAFAPITVLWTIQFLAFTTVFLPIEQLTIRRLNTAHPKDAPWRLFATAIAGTTIVAVGFAAIARERLLQGQWIYVGITAALIVSYGLFALARGFLAGRRRYREYGLSTLAESVVRLALAVAVLLAGFGTVGIAWTLIAGAFVPFIWRPFRYERARSNGNSVEAGSAKVLAAFVAATAASQTILAAGPLVVGALGATAAEVSVFFETFLLFRAPLTVTYSLVARVLPPLTRLVEDGRTSLLRKWTIWLGGAAVLVAVGAYFIGSAVGPAVVELMLGAEFRPAADIAAYAAAGVVLATAALFAQQVLIAMRATSPLAAAWLAALATTVFVIMVTGGGASSRVAMGFLAGEAVALAGLVAVVARRDSRV